MLAPIESAIDCLNFFHSNNNKDLNFIYLITDGSVKNERNICNVVQKRLPKNTRLLTFGIGGFCNVFFLKV